MRCSFFSSILRISAGVAWCAVVGWALGISYLSSLTPAELQIVPSELLASDKLVHAIAFATGGFLLALALRRTCSWTGWKSFAAIVVGIGLFGAFDELHQLFTPGRSGADFYDWVADMTGAIFAATIYCWRHGRPVPNSATSAKTDPPTP